jgi:hypothetical protein
VCFLDRHFYNPIPSILCKLFGCIKHPECKRPCNKVGTKECPLV